MKGLTDYHCHLYEIRESLFFELEKAKKNCIQRWISCALTKQELDWHLKLKSSSIDISAGIHPQYINHINSIEINQLEYYASEKKIYAIGEIGLDANFPDLDNQKKILLKQLEIARSYELPVIIHVVKKYYDLYKILKNNFPELEYIIHGFQGSLDVVSHYSELPNLKFSIGGRLLKRKNHMKIIREIIDSDNFVFETDAPFGNPFTGESTELSELNNIVAYIANHLSLDAETLFR